MLAVEHHLGFLAASDWIIELGPGGGAEGGRLVAEGTPDDIRANPKSVTGPFLSDPVAARGASPAPIMEEKSFR